MLIVVSAIFHFVSLEKRISRASEIVDLVIQGEKRIRKDGELGS